MTRHRRRRKTVMNIRSAAAPPGQCASASPPWRSAKAGLRTNLDQADETIFYPCWVRCFGNLCYNDYAAVVDCDFNIRSSPIDSRSTERALLRNKAAIAAPTRISGQLASNTFTPSAATNTDRLAMISLREHNQVERMLRSLARWRKSNR